MDFPIDLKCARCGQEFNTSDRVPLQMNVCEHVFCKSCLRSMLNDLKITDVTLKCPRCQKLNKLDPNVKRNLSFFQEAKAINQKIRQIIEERGQPKCKDHPDNNSNLICLNCATPSDQTTFCVTCASIKHQNCPKVLVQSRKDLEQLLKKGYQPITSELIRSQFLSTIDLSLKQIRESFERLLNESLVNFDQEFVKYKQLTIDDFINAKDELIVATSAKEIRVHNYIDPFVNSFMAQFEVAQKQSETVLSGLTNSLKQHIRDCTWIDLALNDNVSVANLKHLLTESEKYPKVEELISLEKLNSLRMQFSLLEKQKMKEQNSAKDEVIEQYLLAPKKSISTASPKPDVLARETLRNPLNLDPISAKITQGCPDRLKLTIDQGEALSLKAAESFETDPSKTQPLLKGDRFVVIENWILSRKIELRTEGNRVYFNRKSGSTSQTLHCLVNMQKIAQESLFRIRLINYDNSCCSHFGFCDIKEIECIKNNKMRFSSKHARCYITNGYAPCILESQQFLGVKWIEEDKNFQQGDVIYIHVVPQRAIHFFLQRQNITITFEKFDGHCDLRLFMTFVNKSNEYEFEQLL